MTRPAVILVLLLAAAAHGDVRATLPLQGYHRPGMFMPVKVEGATQANIVEITGTAVVTTRMTGSGIAPVLVTRIVDGLVVNHATVEGPFRAVPQGIRLIGHASAKPRAAEPGAIRIALDPLDPVPGPAAAWEALDELVVDAVGAQRIGDAKLTALVAAGVMIVATGEARPAGSLPWQRAGDAWRLRPALHGPRRSVLSAAMLPVAGWEPGLPDAFRRRTLFAGVLFAILATGAALWRSKRATFAMAALVVMFLAATHAWKARQPLVTTVGGSIIVEGPSLTQVDAWSYHIAADETTITLPAGARPVAESPEALSRLELTLIAPDVFACRLPRGGRVASLTRTLTAGRAAPPIDPALTSPLAPLARTAYLRPGLSIVGQVPSNPWPAIVLRP